MTSSNVITLEQAADLDWDVIVVGAGPAGAIAARELGRHGCRILLVDKKCFPRPKVCGSCLSQSAIDALKHVGLGEVAKELGGKAYDRFQLCSRGAKATVKLPTGFAVSREVLDHRLVIEAARHDVFFLSGATAKIEDSSENKRRLRLAQFGREVTIESRIVIAADGVGGRLLSDLPEAELRTWEHSRIGAAAMIKVPQCNYRNSAIHMGVSGNGYVGLVRVENDFLNIAAALDKQFVRRCGSLPSAARHVLRESRMPAVENIDDAAWLGTSQLTRRLRHAGFHRLLAIGDSAGYAEPFTGEGMAWAMISAIKVVPFVLSGLREWTPQIASRWSAAYRKTIRGRQNACYRLATLLRYPQLVHLAVVSLSLFPWLADPIVRRINGPAGEPVA